MTEATYVPQVGGDHYQTDSGKQHWDFMEAGDVPYLEATGSKYVCRFKEKGRPVEDLQKAASYFRKVAVTRGTLRRSMPIDLIIEMAAVLGLDEWQQQVILLTHWRGAPGDYEEAARRCEALAAQYPAGSR